MKKKPERITMPCNTCQDTIFLKMFLFNSCIIKYYLYYLYTSSSCAVEFWMRISSDCLWTVLWRQTSTWLRCCSDESVVLQLMSWLVRVYSFAGNFLLRVLKPRLLIQWEEIRQGPQRPACFLKSQNQPLHTAEAEKWKVARPGQRGALLCYSSFQLSIVSSSVWARRQRAGQGGVY